MKVVESRATCLCDFDEVKTAQRLFAELVNAGYADGNLLSPPQSSVKIKGIAHVIEFIRD